jgi:hypothetical protein
MALFFAYRFTTNEQTWIGQRSVDFWPIQASACDLPNPQKSPDSRSHELIAGTGAARLLKSRFKINESKQTVFKFSSSKSSGIPA